MAAMFNSTRTRFSLLMPILVLSQFGCSVGLNSSARSTEGSNSGDNSSPTVQDQADQSSIPVDIAGSFLACIGKKTDQTDEVEFGCNVLSSNRKPLRDLIAGVSYKWVLTYNGKEVEGGSSTSLLLTADSRYDRIWRVNAKTYPDHTKLKPRVTVSAPGYSDSEVSRSEIDPTLKLVEDPKNSLTIPNGTHVVFLSKVSRSNPAIEFNGLPGLAMSGLAYVCNMDAAGSVNPEVRKISSHFVPFIASAGANVTFQVEQLAKSFPGPVVNVKGELVAKAGELIRSETTSVFYYSNITSKLNMTAEGKVLNEGANVTMWTGLPPDFGGGGVVPESYSCGNWDNTTDPSKAGFGVIGNSGVVRLHGGYTGCRDSSENPITAQIICISDPVR